LSNIKSTRHGNGVNNKSSEENNSENWFSDQDATSSKLFLNFLPNKEWYPTWVSGSMNAGLDY